MKPKLKNNSKNWFTRDLNLLMNERKNKYDSFKQTNDPIVKSELWNEYILLNKRVKMEHRMVKIRNTKHLQ